MTVYYFGEPWDAPAVDGGTRVSTPVGEVCSLCPDRIEVGDRGYLRSHVDARPRWFGRWRRVKSRPVHAGCEAYAVVGHAVGVCGCTGHPPSRAAGLLVLERLRDGDYGSLSWLEDDPGHDLG